MPEHVFRIQKASAMGFCSGVRRAITILEKSSKVEGPLQTLGPVVHNRQVVDRLASEGISSAGGLNEITGGKIAIPSHGVSPTTAGELSRRGLHVIDATCPTVHRAQVAAKKLADGGFFVIIFGSPDHPEVKGLLGWAGDKSRAVTDTQTLSAESLPKKIGVISQTTQNKDKFLAFITELLESVKDRFTEVRIVNTICPTTSRQQESAVRLSRKSDLVLVIGGKDSSNTRRLTEICAAQGVETHQVETAKEIDPAWLAGKRRVGVTAGASTPDWSWEEVIDKLKIFQGKLRT